MRKFYIAALFVAGILLVGCNTTTDRTIVDPYAVQWCVTPQDAEEAICEWDIFTPGDTAEESLLDVVEANNQINVELEQFDFGAFISSVNGYSPDVSSEFWKLMINGEDAQVGISDYKLEHDDLLEIQLDEFDSTF